MTQAPLITAERLREILMYDHTSGVFTFRVRRGSMKVGTASGVRKDDGRIAIKLEGRYYLAHRLAWLYVHGVWPEQQIDHIDGNPLNNGIANLRDVSPTTNSQNRRFADPGSKSGLLGAQWCKGYGNWQASIRVKGTRMNLGKFDSAQEAHEAYVQAKRRFHDGCTI